MRRTAVVMAMLALGVPALGTPMALAADARPEFSVDSMRLPPLILVQPKAERDRQSLIAAGAGAVIGIIAVDVVTGGLALAPLGLPTFASLMGGGAAAAIPAPTYTLAQQLLAGVTSMVAALGGGYFGMVVAGPIATP